MRISTSKQHSSVRGPLRECRSIRSGTSGLPYYCTPLVCISAVIGLLTVWRHNKPKTIQNPKTKNQTFGQLPLEIVAWLQDTFGLEQQVVTSALTINCLFPVAPSVLGTSWGDTSAGYHWRVTVDNFCPDLTGPAAPWAHRCLLVLNEPREGDFSRVWEKISATARLRKVVVVIHERPGGKHLSRTHYRRNSTNDVTCTELAIFPAGNICFGHAAGWNDCADMNGMSTNSNRASSRHSHTWTCDEDGHLVVPDTHCPGVLRRHDGVLNKRDVRILLLGPLSSTKETLDRIRIRDVRKLAFLLGGTGGRTSGNPKDGPVWYGSGEAI